jgi:hypothetical protein
VSDANYRPQGAVIRLGAPPGEVVERAVEVPAALADVCRPLEVTLVPGTREPGSDYLVPEEERPARRIVRSELPDRVALHGDATAPELDGSALEAWLTATLAAEPAPPGLEVTISTLLSSACCARVDTDADTYVVVSDVAVEHPVVRHAWVPAPVDGLLMQPPVSWRVGLEAGLYAELWVNWSPWLDAERPEAQRLQAAVDALRAQGWEPR